MKKLLLCLSILSFAFSMNAQRHLTAAESGNTINVSSSEKDGKLIVSLEYSAGTPYSWKVVSDNKEVLIFDKQSNREAVKSVPSDPPRVGGKRIVDFEFHFTGTIGMEKLQLDFSSFSGEIARSVNYMINVSEGQTEAVKE